LKIIERLNLTEVAGKEKTFAIIENTQENSFRLCLIISTAGWSLLK